MEKLNNRFDLGPEFGKLRKDDDVLEEEVETVSKTWDPGNSRKFRLEQLARSLVDTRCVCNDGKAVISVVGLRA